MGHFGCRRNQSCYSGLNSHTGIKIEGFKNVPFIYRLSHFSDLHSVRSYWQESLSMMKQAETG